MDALVFVGAVALLASLFLVPRPTEIKVRRRQQAVPSLALVRVFRGK